MDQGQSELEMKAGQASGHAPDRQVKGADAAGIGQQCVKKSVLLVEDEPSLLALTAKLLERLGYHVVPAQNPGDAIEIARDDRRKIDVLLSDIMMPQMNGNELSGIIRGLRPGIKCLLMSGYTSDMITERRLLGREIHFIQKPFTKKELAACMQELFQPDS